MQRAITIGVVINSVGLLCNLLAAQQIIGLFAIKVFTSSAGGGGASRAALFGTGSAALFNDNTLQPLDILIIQANTNVLLSQYISLMALLSLVPNILHQLHKYQQSHPPHRTTSNSNNNDDDNDDTTITKTTTSSTTTTIVNNDEWTSDGSGHDGTKSAMGRKLSYI